MSAETDIFLIDVPCEVCEHVVHYHFKLKKNELFIIHVYFPIFFIPRSIK
jgi:hypothetical protein